jgi:hypothetical protein
MGGGVVVDELDAYALSFRGRTPASAAEMRY